jgi:ketosteroid isomerase-like protein
MEPVVVVRSAWDAYLAGDVDGALRFFAADAEWHAAGDFPGPAVFRGHDELRVILGSTERFSVRRVAVTEIIDMGAFVLAHGTVYVEEAGEPVIDRVTTWRFRVDGQVIASVEVQALPSSERWDERHGRASEG